jgi:hypothetical protein
MNMIQVFPPYGAVLLYGNGVEWITYSDHLASL